MSTDAVAIAIFNHKIKKSKILNNNAQTAWFEFGSS